jgi:hypothetical protein
MMSVMFRFDGFDKVVTYDLGVSAFVLVHIRAFFFPPNGRTWWRLWTLRSSASCHTARFLDMRGIGAILLEETLHDRGAYLSVLSLPKSETSVAGQERCSRWGLHPPCRHTGNQKRDPRPNWESDPFLSHLSVLSCFFLRLLNCDMAEPCRHLVRASCSSA